MKRSILTVLCLLPLGMAGLAGCTTSKSGESTAELRTNNVTGTVSTTLPVGLDDAYDAARRAVDSMQFTTTKQSKDAMKGLLTAKTADGTNVDVTLERDGDRITRLSVNAGPLKSDVAKTLARKIQEMAR